MTTSMHTSVQKLFALILIAISLAIGIPIGQVVLRNQKIGRASKTAVELRTAILNYYTEYKRYPSLNEAAGDTEVLTDGSNHLISALMPAQPEGNIPNHVSRRGILFFSAPRAKSVESPGVFGERPNLGLNDPWGNPYAVVYDSNYDGVIEIPKLDIPAQLNTIRGDVAVWSSGRNGAFGMADEDYNDDIYAYP